MSRSRVAVAIQRSTACAALPEAPRARAWIRAAAAGAREGEITVRFVDEAESAELNGRYGGRPAPTNVLAFPAEAGLEGAGELLPIGDLVVCAPVVVREAGDQGKPVEAHWAHILIHGCLHLLGYDHDTDERAEAMESRERELLAGFGFEDPYANRA